MEEQKNARDRLWHRFRQTGKVEDYLRYARDDTEFAEENAEEEKEEPKE